MNPGRIYQRFKDRLAFYSPFSLWPLLLPVVILLPLINSFPYPSADPLFSDLTLTHYPRILFIKKSLIEYHQLPLWFPTILSGAPLAANPLSGFWYPPGWLALLLPLPFGFNLLMILHLIFGGLGMYLLLREEGLGHLPAMIGGLAFEAMPKLFSHYGAGHLTLLYAVPWTPWLIRACRIRLEPSKKYFFYSEALILAMIIFADIRWAIYAGFLWWGYSLARFHSLNVGRFRNVVKDILYLAVQSLVALFLALPLLLPLFELTNLSSRAFLRSEDVLIYSLPIVQLLSLSFPVIRGFHEWVLYPGALVFSLMIFSLASRKFSPEARIWKWTSGISILVSLGASIPGMDIVFTLPGFDLLRVPSRALFLSGMSLAALAAYSVQYLMGKPEKLDIRRINLTSSALVGFGLILTAGAWMVSGSLSFGFLWSAGLLLIGSIWLGLYFQNKVKDVIWYCGLLGLCLLDWGVINSSAIVARSALDVLKEGQEVANFIVNEESLYRTYSPSYSLPLQTAASFDIQLADGVDPLQLQTYVEFMTRASGVPWRGYSVTLPPFRAEITESGDPLQSSSISQINQPYTPDPTLLGYLNVLYVIADFDVSVDGLNFTNRIGDTRVYLNDLYLPRAWLQPVNLPIGLQYTSVDKITWSPNRIAVDVNGPGLLVLSEIAYPGWRVTVDGIVKQVQSVEGLLRGVELEPGVHHVIFFFQPVSLFVGLLLSILVGLMLIIHWVKQRRLST